MPVSLYNFRIHRPTQLLKWVCIILGVALLLVSLFLSSSSREKRTLWIIDNSLSMQAQDIQMENEIFVSRLEWTKDQIKKQVQNHPGQYGLMTTAGVARVLSPMIDDIGRIREFITGITPIIYGGGSSLDSPLTLIQSLYGDDQSLSIYWFTDGEFSDAESIKRRDPRITLIGVGSREGAPIIEGYDGDGKPRYKTSDGKRVISKRDDETLTRVASALGARVILDGDLTNLISASKNTTNLPDLCTLIGVALIILGLILPLYRYTD